MNYKIKLFISILLLCFYSCSTNEVETNKRVNNNITNNSNIEEEQEIYNGSQGTKLKGRIIDATDEVWIGVEDARIYTIPETDESYTNEEGIFELASKSFIENIPYIIKVESEGYMAGSWTGIKVKLDSIITLPDKYLNRMPEFNIKTDSTFLRSGSLDAPVKPKGN